MKRIGGKITKYLKFSCSPEHCLKYNQPKSNATAEYLNSPHFCNFSNFPFSDITCPQGHKMNHLMSMVKEKDTPLWLCMNKQQLQPQFFAFRWLTLLLSQEFPLPGEVSSNHFVLYEMLVPCTLFIR